MRLCAATSDRIPPAVERFAYDRAAQGIGIVHFGIGAFHRAHQAWYTDRAMDGGDRGWGIAGVSLRSRAVAEQMNPQDGLYTVCERSSAGVRLRLVGAVREVLVAGNKDAEIAARIAAATTRIVSFTVTEKGYCRGPDGSLDQGLAGRGSFYPHLAEGLRRRRAGGLGGLTLLSCDNLAGNGRQLERLVGEYLKDEADLAAWVAAECTFPSTMVDRIVPATTPEDRELIGAAMGLRDEAAVVTEPFSQWVIEDRFAGPRPAWEKVGAELVRDGAPYETAKLRLLNGAHSALAYLGLAGGHRFVHEAIADPQVRALVERLMRDEAMPTLAAAPGQDLFAYTDALLVRFANPALNHRLAQIAEDGSQKIPQRWLATLADRQRAGQRSPALLTALAAWLRHARGDNGAVVDPLAQRLAEIWSRSGEDHVVQAIFGPAGLLASAWNPEQEERHAISEALAVG